MNKPNLTVERFPRLLADAILQNQVRELIRKAKTCAAFAVDWRNRRLAHLDLDLILSTRPKPLLPATRKKVEESLPALRDVLNHIKGAYCNAETGYDLSATPGDAEGLLYVIRDGLLRERDRRGRWKRGELHDDDMKPLEEVQHRIAPDGRWCDGESVKWGRSQLSFNGKWQE